MAKYFRLPDFLPDELIADDDVYIDSSLIITDVVTTDKEILESSSVERWGNWWRRWDGIEIFDEPVAMPPSIGFGNTLETLQKLGLFNKNGNEVWVLLQQLESLHVCNSLNSRTQSSFLTFFKRK